MSRMPKRHFWDWFQRNNKEYLELNKKAKKEANYWLSEMTAHLRAYARFLSFTIVMPGNENVARLIITANGRKKLLKKAEAFAAMAPNIPGWYITALEEPMPIDFMLEASIKITGIHPSEFNFSFYNNEDGGAIITVYHPLCTWESQKHLLALAYDAVYNLLGERSFANDIHSIDVENLSSAGEAMIYPLEELCAHIGLSKSAMTVGADGFLRSME